MLQFIVRPVFLHLSPQAFVYRCSLDHSTWKLKLFNRSFGWVTLLKGAPWCTCSMWVWNFLLVVFGYWCLNMPSQKVSVTYDRSVSLCSSVDVGQCWLQCRISPNTWFTILTSDIWSDGVISGRICACWLLVVSTFSLLVRACFSASSPLHFLSTTAEYALQ